MTEPLVSYRYKDSPDHPITARFIQYKKDPLPPWAVDVQDYFEDEPPPWWWVDLQDYFKEKPDD
jgi:hypothetical protein